MGEKIPYWRASRLRGAFVEKTGEEGCEICPDENVRLSMDRAPPPLRDQPAKEKIDKRTPEQIERAKNPNLRFADSLIKVADGFRSFKAWLKEPPPLPKPVAAVAEATSQWVEDCYKFDLQDIPDTIRRLGMPKAAKMFDKWFEGELNYSPTDQMSKYDINQELEPYPSSMIDRTSISLSWVLSFARANAEYESLIEKYIYSEAAAKQLKKCLEIHRNENVINAWAFCDDDIKILHQKYQFQLASVEGSLWQKALQYLTRSAHNHGIPDELTLILGSFNLYAAVSRAVFSWRRGRRIATITHIYVYVRDGFTFTDKQSDASQYLGHWSKKSFAIVPLKIASSYLANINWVNYPVIEIIGSGASVLHPVLNSDFRAWQIKHGRGGDYIIYTKEQGVMLGEPIVVELP